MARRKLYGQFHQPSHILRYYHIEMECFVYNWAFEVNRDGVTAR